MPNQQKRDIVAELSDKFARAKGIYFADYLGLNVASITELRRQFHEKGVEFRVVKNTLAKISVERLEWEGLDEAFTGSTAVALSYDDPASPARVLKDFRKAHDLPEVKLLVFEGRVMDKGAFSRIANLPSRQELLASLVSGLSSPMRNLVATLRSPLFNLVNVLKRVKDTKQT